MKYGESSDWNCGNDVARFHMWRRAVEDAESRLPHAPDCASFDFDPEKQLGPDKSKSCDCKAYVTPPATVSGAGSVGDLAPSHPIARTPEWRAAYELGLADGVKNLQTPEGVTYAIAYLFARVGSWTSGRFDQHLRHMLGDVVTDEILAWLGAHVSPRLGKGEDGLPRYVSEGPVSMAKDIFGSRGGASNAERGSDLERRLKVVEGGLKFLLERFDAHEKGAEP